VLTRAEQPVMIAGEIKTAARRAELRYLDRSRMRNPPTTLDAVIIVGAVKGKTLISEWKKL
jgi:hypothetical protein